MLQGKGMFIWQIERCDQGNVGALVSLARAAQLTHVIFLLSDGTYNFPLPSQDQDGSRELKVDAAIRAFQNAGIGVWALAHTQGADPAMEAHRAASRVLRWNLDGLVVNPQAQYTGQHERARQYMATLREDLGRDPDRLQIAFSLFRSPDSLDVTSWEMARRFPVDEFASQCDLIMPQVYWIARDGGNPAAALQESYSQYQRRYPNKPFVPTGAAFGEQYGSLAWTATPQQVVDFLRKVRELNLAAANFWSWQHARNDQSNPQYKGTELWDALAGYSWPVGDMPDVGEPPAPPPAEDPFADSVEVIAPGDARYLDGIYTRFSLIRFRSMQSAYGTVKYANVHDSRSTLWAQWVPGITRSGRYEISVFVPGTHATTRRARYHVRGLSGPKSTVVVELNQNRYYDRFVSLGVFELDGTAPDAGAINLNNLTGESGYEIAFSPVKWRLLGDDEPSFGLADGYDAPVGTAVERASDRIWPGEWLDANSFGRRYPDSTNSTALHTGSDLNLNVPHWDADRGAPVYAIASGIVTFAGRLPIWGEMVIIRHDPVEPGGQQVWARYAHVAQLKVRAGEHVSRGQQIGVIGKPEPPGAPYHLHFDICISGIIEQAPGHWPRLNHQELVKHYTDPRAFLLANRPPEHKRR